LGSLLRANSVFDSARADFWVRFVIFFFIAVAVVLARRVVGWGRSLTVAAVTVRAVRFVRGWWVIVIKITSRVIAGSGGRGIPSRTPL